jgi:hypothetical protein
MKQIGSRQESSIIGGIGTCGRELCCSTWKSDFQTVTTTAARYQNLAINQTKLTGQCGRLKCCLNYELDTYIDALNDFPKKADVIKIANGRASLVKTDIFKGIMYYGIQKDNIRGPLIALHKDKVKKILELNKKGVEIENIATFQEQVVIKPEDEEIEFADVTGEIELPEIKRRKKRRNPKGKGRGPRRDNRSGGDKTSNRGPRKNSGDKKESRERKSSGPKDAPKRDGNKSPQAKTNNDTTNQGNKSTGQKPNKNKSRFKKKRGPKPNGPNNKSDNNNTNKKD